MASTCWFCGKRFKSKPAVRGHLRTCQVYLEEKSSGGAEPELSGAELELSRPTKLIKLSRAEPKLSGAESLDPLSAEVRREKSRLALREVRAAHRSLDEQEAAADRKAQERLAAEREREQARLDALRAEQERARRQEQARRERERRAGLLSIVVDASIGRFSPPYGVTIPPELTERAVAEIERVAATLPLDEIAFTRMRVAAIRVRDRLYGPEIERQEKNRRRKPDLVRSGLAYAQGEVEARGPLALRQWPALYARLYDELPKRLTGDETEAEVEDIVDRLLWRGRAG